MAGRDVFTCFLNAGVFGDVENYFNLAGCGRPADDAFTHFETGDMGSDLLVRFH